DDSGPPPPSRGTEMSVPEYLQTTANTSPTHGHYQTTSMSSSVRPLQINNSNGPGNPNGLTVNTGLTTFRNQGLPTPSKSPHSFRSSFLLPSRGGDLVPHSPNRSNHGHEKLSSGATSPAPRPSDATPLPSPTNPSPGAAGASGKGEKGGVKNYTHFPGNTRFFLGGRFQNARDRPVNIATGILVIVPAILFFVFQASWLWHRVSPAVPVVFAYFFTFVAGGTAMAVYCIVTSVIQLSTVGRDMGKGFGDAISRERGVFALLIYAALALPYPAALLFYHIFLSGRGETTRELLNGRKFKRGERHRPFTLGSVWKNWVAVMGRPRGGGYMGFKRVGDQKMVGRWDDNNQVSVRGGNGEMMEMRGMEGSREGAVV
ncbi:hypothetical protein V495_08225, partial [Pseudogymnoascus sp. VKM F-4514 (FW-929)]